MADAEVKQRCLAQARALIEHLEAGNEREVDHLLDELTRAREGTLFQELGRLTRDLHEALNNFRLDTRISEITEKDIPDAKDRLTYVISMTEQAANRTLDVVEQSLPVSEQLARGAVALTESWERFRRREMEAGEFREMSRRIGAFLHQVEDDASRLRASLSEVLMAQDFQDLTGQIIRRVITLVQEVEDNLVGLIRMSGQKMLARNTASEGSGPDTVPNGPQIPGRAGPDVVSGQDAVDDLLSSLGF